MVDFLDWMDEDLQGGWTNFVDDDENYLPNGWETLPEEIEFPEESEVEEMNTAERLEHCAYHLGLKDALLLLIEAQKNGDSLEDAIENIQKLIASTK